MGIGPPWRGAGLRRDRFHHYPGRPYCRPLSLFRQAAMKISRRHLFAAGGSTAMIAIVGSAGSRLGQSAASQTPLDLSMTPDTLDAKAREAMIDIFRKKDPAAVDRYFAESFIQHDPSITGGVA